jgi:hypothetical protein
MHLTPREIQRWSLYLKAALIKADTTYDPKSKLAGLVESCRNFNSTLQQAEVTELPSELTHLLERIHGRVNANRIFIDPVASELRYQALALVGVYLPNPGTLSLSKEHELIDSLAKLVMKAAEETYVRRTNARRHLSILFPAAPEQAQATLSRTASSSGQWLYDLHCVDPQISALYQPLLKEMNRYARTDQLKQTNQPEELLALDVFISNCTQLLNTPHYAPIAEKFQSTLAALKRHVQAEHDARSQATVRTALN